MNEMTTGPTMRPILIRLGLTALVAAVFFGGGYLTRDLPARGMIAEARAARDAAESSRRAQVVANRLLSANVWVYRAAVALDDRNFGVANNAMDEAVKALEAVTLLEGDPLQTELSAVLTAAQALDISVASNLAPQREALLNLARRVNALNEQSQALAAQA